MTSNAAVPDSLGARIKETREKRGRSIASLARELKITPQAASNWELGRSQPRPELLTRVANTLQVDRTYLVNGTLPTHGSTPALVENPNVYATYDAPDAASASNGGPTSVKEVLSHARIDIASILKVEPQEVEIWFSLKG